MSTAAVVVARPAVATGEKRALDGAWMLSLSTAVSGGLAYAFHVLAARSLGSADYGRIAVLWAAMFLLVVVLFRPLEQTTSRAVADRLARGDRARGVMRSVLTLYLGIVAVLIVVVAAAWAPITNGIFLGDDVLTGALVAGVAGYGLAYVLRGLLSGSGWFEGYGLLLLADSGIRLLAAAPLVAVASSDVAAVAVAVAGIGGAVIPAFVGRKRLRALVERPEGSRFHVRGALAFAAPVTVIAAADQVLINGGPILVVLGGGSAKTAGIVFAATMLVRVPVYLFQGLAASLLPNLTRLSAHDDVLFRRGVIRTAAVLFGLGVGAIAGAAVVGPAALGILYGDEFSAERLDLTLLGVGVAFYLVAATVSQALLALAAVRSAAAAWSASAIVFLLLYVVLDGGELFRIAAALAASTALGAISLVVVLALRLRR